MSKIIIQDVTRILRHVENEERLGRFTKLNDEDSRIIRAHYESQCRTPLGVTDANISNGKVVFAVGYDRIVIGDYGAYLEIPESKILYSNIRVKSGQEYRIDDPRYKNTVKYWWLEPVEAPLIKIYFQVKPVTYADYKPFMFYVSATDPDVKIHLRSK